MLVAKQMKENYIYIAMHRSMRDLTCSEVSNSH